MVIGTPQVLTMVLGTLLPLITGWVVRLDAHSAVRAVTLLLLSGLTSFLTDWLNSINGHTAFDFKTVGVTALVTFIVGVGTHYGFWQHLGVSKFFNNLPGFIGPINKPVPAAGQHEAQGA